MKIKAFVGKYQLINWFKGTIFLIIGILNSRFDVGYNWFIDNLIWGPIIYFMLIVSGMLVVLYLKIPEENTGRKINKKNVIKIISIVLFLTAYAISSVYVFYFDRDLLTLIILSVIGLGLGASFLYGDQWEKKSILNMILIGFIISFGILYGALLNAISIPIYLYIFFLGAFTLQFSKEILKSCKRVIEERTREGKSQLFAEIVSLENAQKIVLILQALTIVFLILPMILEIYNSFLYLIPMIICAILVGIAAIFNLIYDFENGYKGRIFILLRVGMLFMILAFFFASI